jgi:cytochrome c-type biogenesis protein CcmH
VRLLRVPIAALAAVLLLGSPLALADGPADPGEVKSNATLPDIEDEVMCTICGTALQLANSPQANRERAFINDLIAKGKTKDEIKDALVDEYGPAVLAVPDAEGFDLAAFVVPVGGVLIALLLIGLAARRWRRSAAASPAPVAALDADDDERLSADLRRYEG